MMSETDNYPDLNQETKTPENFDNSPSKEDTDITEDDTFLEKPKSAEKEVEDSVIVGEETDTKEVVTEAEIVEDTSTTEGEEISSSETVEGVSENTNAKIESLEAQIIQLKTELEKQNEYSKDVQGQYMRLTADFDNFRRRVAREKEELEGVIKKKIITELLPVVDNFERARSQIKPTTEGETAIHKSYQGVYKNLVEGLKKNGVSAMRPENQPFDPNFHEAMLREPTNDYPEGTVIEQLVRGYMVDDQVLRYAMVKVAVPGEVEKTDNNQSPENDA